MRTASCTCRPRTRRPAREQDHDQGELRPVGGRDRPDGQGRRGSKAEDHRRFEAAQSRNALDALVHSVKKSLAEHGDKVGADEKSKIESALRDAEELLKQSDATKDALDGGAQALRAAAQKLTRRSTRRRRARRRPAIPAVRRRRRRRTTRRWWMRSSPRSKTRSDTSVTGSVTEISGGIPSVAKSRRSIPPF